MSIYKDEYLQVFLDRQLQLLDEPIAENMEDAEAFLEDCMAVILDSPREVKEHLEEMGMDVVGMSLDDILESSEVFPLPDGKYLIVEG